MGGSWGSKFELDALCGALYARNSETIGAALSLLQGGRVQCDVWTME